MDEIAFVYRTIEINCIKRFAANTYILLHRKNTIHTTYYSSTAMLIAHKKHIICVTKQRRLCQVKATTDGPRSLDYEAVVLLEFPEIHFVNVNNSFVSVIMIMDHNLKSMMYFPARTVLGRINFWQKDTFHEKNVVNY